MLWINWEECLVNPFGRENNGGFVEEQAFFCEFEELSSVIAAHQVQLSKDSQMKQSEQGEQMSPLDITGGHFHSLDTSINSDSLHSDFLDISNQGQTQQTRRTVRRRPQCQIEEKVSFHNNGKRIAQCLERFVCFPSSVLESRCVSKVWNLYCKQPSMNRLGAICNPFEQFVSNAGNKQNLFKKILATFSMKEIQWAFSAIRGQIIQSMESKDICSEEKLYSEMAPRFVPLLKKSLQILKKLIKSGTIPKALTKGRLQAATTAQEKEKEEYDALFAL